MKKNKEIALAKEIKIEKAVEKQLVNTFNVDNELLNKHRPLLKLRGVTKKFGQVIAVNNVSFEIKKGERVGIIGANGSGKTTITEIIAGLTEVTSGEVEYGFNILISRRQELINEKRKFKSLKRSINTIQRAQLKKYKIDVKKVKKSSSKNKVSEINKLNENKTNNFADNSHDIRVLTKNYSEIVTKLRKEKEEAKIVYKSNKTRFNNSSKTDKDKFELKIAKKGISYRHPEIKIKMDELSAQKWKYGEKVFKYTRFFETLNKNKIEKYRQTDAYKKAFAEYKKYDDLINELGFIKVPQEKMGMQFQDSQYPSGLSLKNIIRFAIRLHKLPISDDEVLEMLKTFQMDDFYKRDGRSLSGGQRQKLNIFLAILHSPELIIMDELSTGLDLSAREEIIKFVNNILQKKKIASILISHHMEEIEALCDRVIVFDKGSIERDTTVEKLKKEFGSLSNFMRFIIEKGHNDTKEMKLSKGVNK